jgi:Uri superfamily endonuclease
MKIGGGSGIVEKNKNKRGVEKSKKRRHVEYLAIRCKVVVAFIIIFGMCKREGV